ncbi:MAG: hypothetical protein FWG82_02185 [Oscillospiraceae bacterium]|nr:hypothetical protein [Oscillospiraceae bacterium]
MREKKPAPTMKIIFGVILVIVTAGMIYQLAAALYQPIKTVSAIPAAGSEVISVHAIAIRDETPLTLPDSGYTLLARDGARLDKGASWAAAFSSKKQAADYRNLQEKEQLRERLLKLQNSTLTGLSTHKLEAQVSELFLDFLDSCADGIFADVPETLAAVSEKWGVLSALSGGDADYTRDKIAALDKEISALRGGLQSERRQLTPAAGIYIGYSDGFEDLQGKEIALAHAKKQVPMSVKTIDKLLMRQPAPADGGRLVTSVRWYFAANVDALDAQLFKVGDEINGEIAALGGRRVRLILESIGERANDRFPMIFSCAAQDSELLRLRVTGLNLLLKEETGLSIPREAVRVVDGETGVYVSIAGKIQFRRMIIRANAENYVIVRELSQEERESLGDKNKPSSAIALKEKLLDDEAKAMNKKRPAHVQRYDKVIVQGKVDATR